MQTLSAIIFVAITAVALSAQSKPIAAAEYNAVKSNAVRVTNTAFPFVFKVVKKTFDGGKLVSTETQVSERQDQGVERETKTLEKGGKTLRSYSVMVGFGENTYCSFDGVSWNGPQGTVCPGPDRSATLMLSVPRQPESTEHLVTEKTIAGQPVKVFRKYAIYGASQTGGKKFFTEEVITIDARGFFTSVTTTEGTLDPKIITLTRTQTWDHKTKFKPVIAPK